MDILTIEKLVPERNLRFLNPERILFCIKVLQEVNEEVLPQEPSIDDDEYNLIKSCLKRRRNERIRLLDLKDEIQEMRLKIKSGAMINNIICSIQPFSPNSPIVFYQICS